MTRAHRRGAISALLFGSALFVGAAYAAPAPGTSASAPALAPPGVVIMASATASLGGSATPAPSTSMPAPPQNLPPGHPPMGDPNGMMGQPPMGQPGGEEMPGAMMPRVPRDFSGPSRAVAAQTVEAVVVDEKDQPLVGVPVTLSLLRQSIAQGDTRSTRTETSNDRGIVRFSGLSTTSDWSYQVKVTANAADSNATATYASPPFNLLGNTGWQVRIHRFPVTTHLDELMAAFEVAVASFDFREDALDVSMEFNLVNMSPKAWSLGSGMELALPNGFKGLRAAEAMDGVNVEAIEGKGARWTGSFPPGQWMIQYEFKVPYEGEPSVDVDLLLPPRVATAAVRVAGRKGTVLKVDGFDAPREDIAPNGARWLTAVKRADPNTPVQRMSVHISGLPEPGPEKWLSIAIGLLGLVGGIYAIARVSPESAAPAPIRARRREQLLADLVGLEKAHRAGEVGPKAYAQERTRLLDAIADTLDAVDAGQEPPKRAPAATTLASTPKAKAKKN